MSTGIGIFSRTEEFTLVEVVPTSTNGSLMLTGFRTGESTIVKSINSSTWLLPIALLWKNSVVNESLSTRSTLKSGK